MSILTTKQKKEYLKNLEFGLKNYEKTYNLYKDYKNEKFNKINKEIMMDLDLFDYTENVANYIYSLKYFFFTIDTYKGKLNCKSIIKMFKTDINNRTYNYNTNLFENYNLNNNEKRIFTIKFYLKNYKFINKAMKKLLINYVKKELFI